MFKQFISASCLAFYALGGFSESHGAIRRHDVPSSRMLSDARVGKLMTHRESLCSAFIIDTPAMPSLRGAVILTAAHCLQTEEKVYFSGTHTTSSVLGAFFPHSYDPTFSGCSTQDVALAFIAPPQRITFPLRLLATRKSADYFFGQTLLNIGYGFTGRGDLSILYEDGKERVVEGKIATPADRRFPPDRFIATNFSDPHTTGLPTFGDCGSPGLINHNGPEEVISLVSCLVSPPIKIIFPPDEWIPSATNEFYPIPGLRNDEIQNETFMHNFIPHLKEPLGRYGHAVFSLYDGAWSYQIYLPNHLEWIVETLQRISLLQPFNHQMEY